MESPRIDNLLPLLPESHKLFKEFWAQYTSFVDSRINVQRSQKSYLKLLINIWRILKVEKLK